MIEGEKMKQVSETESNVRKCASPSTNVEMYARVSEKNGSNTTQYPYYYRNKEFEVVNEKAAQVDSSIDSIAKWFLSQSALSNKKLQKLCYYAYCWYIVFFNDIEGIDSSDENLISTLCSERFQAWIHGPVCPELYRKYKNYGWLDIPQVATKPNFPDEIESLLNKVWNTYGSLSADQLENLSHSEEPWKKARKGRDFGEACANEISVFDIIKYFSSLS